MHLSSAFLNVFNHGDTKCTGLSCACLGTDQQISTGETRINGRSLHLSGFRVAHSAQSLENACAEWELGKKSTRFIIRTALGFHRLGFFSFSSCFSGCGFFSFSSCFSGCGFFGFSSCFSGCGFFGFSSCFSGCGFFGFSSCFSGCGFFCSYSFLFGCSCWLFGDFFLLFFGVFGHVFSLADLS